MVNRANSTSRSGNCGPKMGPCNQIIKYLHRNFQDWIKANDIARCVNAWPCVNQRECEKRRTVWWLVEPGMVQTSYLQNIQDADQNVFFCFFGDNGVLYCTSLARLLEMGLILPETNTVLETHEVLLANAWSIAACWWRYRGYDMWAPMSWFRGNKTDPMIK